MKSRINPASAVLAAIMGLSPLAMAAGSNASFTPIDKLSPELRQVITEQVMAATRGLDVDWDDLVIGLNADGKIAIRARSIIELESTGSFSCAASKVTEKIGSPKEK